MPTKNEKVHACVEDYIRSRITVCPKTGCWLWGKVTRGNYCWFRFGKRSGRMAHVEIYELNRGPVPKGLIVRHTCDDTRCVNPAHLVLGTKKDNRQDFMLRHPRAKELLSEGVKIAQQGCKKFWAEMTAEERKEFCGRRSKIQAEKGGRGHSPQTKAKIKQSWVRRREEGRDNTGPNEKAREGVRDFWLNLTKEERRERALKSWETRRNASEYTI